LGNEKALPANVKETTPGMFIHFSYLVSCTYSIFFDAFYGYCQSFFYPLK